MKETIKLTMKTGLAVGLLTLGLVVGCGNERGTAKAGSEGLQAAIVPGANVVAYYDAEAARNTAIGKVLQDLSEEMGKVGQEMQGQDFNRLQEKFKEVTGLTDDDIVAGLFSISLANIDFEAADPPSMDELLMTGAVELKKPVTGEQLVRFIEAVAEEEGEEPQITETAHGGVTIYTISEMGPEVDADSISIAMIGGDRIGLFGPQAALREAIDRTNAGRVEALSAELQQIRQTVRPGAQAYVIFAMTPALKASAAEEAAAASPNDPTAAAQKAMGSLNGASLSLSMGNQAQVSLIGVFENPDDAAGMTQFFDNMVISTIRMFAGMMLGEKPLPMLQSLQARHDGNQAELSFTLSEADVQTMRAMMAEGGM